MIIREMKEILKYNFILFRSDIAINFQERYNKCVEA